MGSLLPIKVKPSSMALPLVIILPAVLYSFGLPGGFLLDDFANLKTLDRIEGSFSLASLGSFVFSNVSGDLGRPLPLLTFAAQHAAWPSDPGAFKVVNISLHLLNATLLYWLVRLLAECRFGRGTRPAYILAAIVSTAWAVHPLLVSTVLYVVQRMAVMSATFMFLGLAVYVVGRRRMHERVTSGAWLMFGGVVLGTLLAVACKENGALLPLVVLTLEFTLFVGWRRGKTWYFWLICAVLLPLIAMFGFIALQFGTWILPGYSLRDFTLTERLLTEARVLSDYLGQIVLPQPSKLGLFHDDFILSRSLMEPPTTLPAVVLLTTLIVGTVALRLRMPALTMGVVWYFGAQVLESGPIPLELYFEHRNYFPMSGLLAGVGIQVVDDLHLGCNPTRRLRYAMLAAIAWTVSIGFVSLVEVRLWANPLAQAAAWAKERPQSLRAQSHWAATLVEMRFLEGAEDVYDGLTPRDPGFRLQALSTNCLRNGARFENGYDKVLRRLEVTPFSRTALGALERLVMASESGYCLEAARGTVDLTVTALLKNPQFLSRKHHLLVLRGRYWIVSGRYADAHRDFASALAITSNVEIALLMVKSSVLAGNAMQAERDLDQARAVNVHNTLSRWTYAADIAEWAAVVRVMANRASN